MLPPPQLGESIPITPPASTGGEPVEKPLKSLRRPSSGVEPLAKAKRNASTRGEPLEKL